MGRRGGRQTTKRATDRGRRVDGRPRKPKVCVFCRSHVEWVDYKDVNTLRRLMSDRGKIKARRVTGTCRQHQRDVAIAIKTARELALLPYVLSPLNSDKPRRGGGQRDSRASAGIGVGNGNGSGNTRGNADLVDIEPTGDDAAAGDDALPEGTLEAGVQAPQ